MQHSIEVASIIMGRSGLSAPLRREQSFNDPPFHIRQVAACQNRLLKSSIESRFS